MEFKPILFVMPVSYYILNLLRIYEGRNDTFNVTGCL